MARKTIKNHRVDIYECVALRHGKNAGRHVWRSFYVAGDPRGYKQTTGGSRCLGPIGARISADDYPVGTVIHIATSTEIVVLKRREEGR